MKIRVFGFEPVITELPQGFSKTAGFDLLKRQPGLTLGKTLLASAADLENNWIGGVVLKSRDATSFTKMITSGGVSRVTAERLPDGEQLTEANFFLVHPDTGRGLYAYHYKSASLNSDFQWICARIYAQELKRLKMEAQAAPGLTAKQKKQIGQNHYGRFTLMQLLNHGSIEDFIKKLKRVSSIEASFTAFELEEDIFDPLSKVARKKTVKMAFPPDLDPSAIEQELIEITKSDKIDDIWVDGYDKSKHLLEFHRSKNVEIFGEADYDELLGDLEISFGNWPASIANSKVIKYLLGIANGNRVGRLLTGP